MINFRNMACLCLVFLLSAQIVACGSDSSGKNKTDLITSDMIKLESVFPNLSFDRPVLLLAEPDDNNRWYVVEQGGKIFWFDANDQDTTVKNTYLDFSNEVDDSGEGGLLSMAFTYPSFLSHRQMMESCL